MCWSSREHPGLIDHANGAFSGVLQSGGHLQVLHLGVLKDLLHVVDGTTRHARLIEQIHPMLGGFFGKRFVQLRIDKCAVLESARIFLIIGLISQIEATNAGAQGSKLRRARGPNVAVAKKELL